MQFIRCSLGSRSSGVRFGDCNRSQMILIAASKSERLTIWSSTFASFPTGRRGRPERRMIRTDGSTPLISSASCEPVISGSL